MAQFHTYYDTNFIPASNDIILMSDINDSNKVKGCYPIKLPVYGDNVKIVISTIQSVIDSITDASVANPYLIKIPPGVYKEKVVLKDYISIEGAGCDATVITGNGTEIGIAAANGCVISNLYQDGNTYEGEGFDCAWNIGTDDYFSNITFYVYNCKFNSQSSFVHTEGTNIVGYVYNCTGKTFYDGYVAVGDTELFVYNCYTEILYHATFTRKMFVAVGDGAKLHAYNCYVFADLADIGSHIRVVETYSTTANTSFVELFDCVFDITITSGSGVLIGLRANGENQRIDAHNLTVRFSHSGTCNVATSDNSTLNFYNPFFASVGTAGYNIRSYGSTSAVNVYGGSLSSTGSSRVDLFQISDGTINVYGTKYNTTTGLITGTNRQQGTSLSLTDNGTFSMENGNIIKIASADQNRNLNPTGDFAPWTSFDIINDSSYTITVDSTGLNLAVTAGSRASIFYDATVWNTKSS